MFDLSSRLLQKNKETLSPLLFTTNHLLALPKRAYVVPTSLKEQDFRLSLTVRRGIEVFNNIVKKGDTLGISWGKTIYTFMSEYSSDAVIENLNVMPLVGSTDRSLKRYHMNEVVRQFAEKVYGTGRFIHAPIFPVSNIT